MGPGGEQGGGLLGWQSGVVASLADPKDGGNGMPNPARLMGTRKRRDADGSQESQREKRDRTSAAWQSRAELQSGVGWKWCHFPDVRGSPQREGGRERRQKVLRRLFRRMSYERGRSAEGRDGEGRSRGFCVLISQEPTWPLGRSLVGDGAAAAAGGAERCCEPGQGEQHPPDHVLPLPDVMLHVARA